MVLFEPDGSIISNQLRFRRRSNSSRLNRRLRFVTSQMFFRQRCVNPSPRRLIPIVVPVQASTSRSAPCRTSSTFTVRKSILTSVFPEIVRHTRVHLCRGKQQHASRRAITRIVGSLHRSSGLAASLYLLEFLGIARRCGSYVPFRVVDPPRNREHRGSNIAD